MQCKNKSVYDVKVCNGSVDDVVVVFFFKQKTAYEIKECDWSSDVCSSDLIPSSLTNIFSPLKNWLFCDTPLESSNAAALISRDRKSVV